ncbi:hypothetical protein Slin15195_G041990 [Septoria linicola]|uniref:SWI-SNF chromatin-remodeling complex protein n=1 Tax=Septoria linicola TaxID=215465 RepID=A0A9Q9EHD3_9PEZI|nr:hypothetical protein Slin14017_G045500 [Septoria linicola]USW50880.1 hypothetical protein Slin15195_G041990 [Septoria linicola]
MANNNNPLSFKTVPGRHRTQKWNTAPKNTYDGDDWGDYDPYDDYGGQEEAAPPPLPSQASALPSQRLRKQSFDRGDDGMRSVSAPFPAYQQAPASAASGGRGSNDFPRSRSRPRDFTNPDQAPPPLRASASREAVAAPPGFFPPRKSSMGGNTYEAQQEAAEAKAIAESVTNPAVNVGADKPLPFIRPSDIYKRMEDEKRRESEESGRPSIDALDRVTSAERRADLEPVQEQRESVLYPRTYQPHVKERSGNEPFLPDTQFEGSATSRTRGASPTLPLVSRFSGFGDEILTLTSPKAAEDAPVPSRQSPPGLNTAGLATASSSIQPTPTSTRAGPGNDPAAEILAERQQEDGLQHQPSVGFRSAVHQAFDQNDASLSRDNSGSTPGAGVGRSDTSSTAGISPIMSRVPSTATAALTQRQRDGQVPPIVEETSITPTTSRPGSEVVGAGRVARKPSPGHSRNANGEHGPASFEPGYRRSLDPPSSGTSPARTPALETVESRRLSTPLSGVIGADDPDVVDQGAEIVQPDLHPVETPASEAAPTAYSTSAVSPAVPITGRGRSNTDYSVREADLADTINSSPDKDPSSPELAEAAQESKDSRDLFLRTHNMPGASPARGSTPTRSDSPAKSRVREIADKYHQIHDDSRRNSAASIGSSKSGWSTFTDDAKQPKLKRATTGQSQLGQEVDPSARSTTLRPEMGREESFRPDLPGGWINSEAPTPAVEAPPQLATRDVPSPDEPIDLTPTTKKHQLQGAQPTTTTRSPIDAARDFGSQLGAALMGQYGVGHQTRDFASKEAPAPVDQSEALPKRAYGDVSIAPPLWRHETDSTEAPTSVASSAVPTPLPKDTPKAEANASSESGLNAGYFNTVAPLRVRSREPSPEHGIAPRNATSQHLSHVSGDSAEDDRIREEIVRSLDSTADNTVRTQDALNAPDNARRDEHGGSAFPAAAAGAPGLGAAAATVVSNAKTASTKPGLLNTRFSWENSAPLREEPKSPEIKPEAAYERPRSKQLHIMNPEDGALSPDTPAGDRLPELSGTVGGPLSVPEIKRPEAAAAEGEIVRSLSQRVKSPASPVARAPEHLIPETTIEPGSPSQSLHELAPSPISEKSPRIPSYSADSTQETVYAPSTTAAATSPIRPKSSGQSHGQIPAFRNILQIKDADDRIKTYNDTRRTFADMNTGLGDWLQAMTARHPDVLETAEMGKPPPLEPSVTAAGTNQWKRGHRAAAPSMNLTGLKSRFASGSGAPVDGQGRTASTGATGPSNGLASSDTAGGSGGVDLDRVQQQMQQKGKEFMKNAGVFGSKASTGAKGLLAKGRSRFGGSVRGKGGEVPPPSSTKRSPSAFSKLRSLSTSSITLKPGPKPSTSPERDLHMQSSRAVSDYRSAAITSQDTVPVAATMPTFGAPTPASQDARLYGAGPDISPMTPQAQTSDAAVDREGANRVVEDWSSRSNIIEANGSTDGNHNRSEDQETFDQPTQRETNAFGPPTFTDEQLPGSMAVPHRDAAVQDNSAVEHATDNVRHAGATIFPDQTASSVSAIPVSASAVSALAAQISDVESRSEAVQEIKEATPILEEAALQSPVAAQEVPRASVGPSTLSESTQVPSTSLPTDERFASPPMVETESASSRNQAAPPIVTIPGIDTVTSHERSFSDAPMIPLSSTNLAPTTASAFENRPDLSRRTSAASSVLAFRRREGSSTPSSRSSRPISGVFDRLRDKARSWSRTRKEGSRSRPASLVLSHSNLLSDEGLPTPANQSVKATRDTDATHNDTELTARIPHQQTTANDFALMDFRDVAVDPSKSTLPDSPPMALGTQTSPQRTEAWNEPDAQLPPKTPDVRNRNSEHGRLGVLPSPAPTATTFAEGERHASIERSRRRSSAVVRDAWRQGLDDQYGRLVGEPLDVVPSQVPSEESAVVAPVAASSTADRSEREAVQRPQQQRKVSDITMLPSQQRRASESAGMGGGALPPLATGLQNIGFTPRHGRNESEISGLTDAEFVEASPLTMRTAEPTLVHETQAEPIMTNFRPATSDDTGTRDSIWDKEIAEQEAEIQRLGSVRSANQDHEPVVPLQTRDRTAEAPFASIVASATARKQKQNQRLVETQRNPYVLSDSRKTSAGNPEGATDKWEDARSEVSAEEGALHNSYSVHQSTNPSISRRSSVSSIGANAAAKLSDSRAPSEHRNSELGTTAEATAHSSRPTTAPSSKCQRDVPVLFDNGRAATHQPLLDIEEPMSAQAVPAGPSDASPTVQQSSSEQQSVRPDHARTVSQGLLPGVRPPSLGSSDFQKRFSQRLYAQRPDMGERPLSYMTLPRDKGGFVRERIDTGAAGSKRQSLVLGSTETQQTLPAPPAPAEENTIPAADISALSGPPAGTPPFQQHPVFRNSVVDVQPTEYERMRSTSRQGGVLTSPGLTEGPTSPSGEAGYFRNPQPFTSAIPGRNVISDNHGLEDVHAWGETVAIPRDEVPSAGIKQARRRSGMWNAFTNRRTSTGAKLDVVEPIAPLASLENSDAIGANITAGEPERYETVKKGGKKTLQKPQRASSSAVKLTESGPKKKRFSGLKSFLGRSGTTVGESSGNTRIRSSSQSRADDRSRKLQKIAPVAPVPPPQYHQPGNPATVKGGMHSYEDYERARKREMAAYAEQSGRQTSRAAAPSSPMDQERTPTGHPPADGWYGPSSHKTHQDDIGRAHTTDQVSALQHDEASLREDRPAARVPEAFRPVEASFNRSVEPIGPPPGHTPPMRDFGPSEEQQQQYSAGRQERYGSDGSVPVSGRSDYYHAGQRPFGSMSAISPVQPTLPPIQTQGRVVSAGTAMARSPAKDYADQQTPFAINMPGGSRPGSRDVSRGDGQHYQYAETSPPRMQSSQYSQQSQPYSRSSEDRYTPATRPHNGFNYEGRDHTEQQGYDDGRGYPSPPYSPQQQAPYDWMSRQALNQGQQYSHPSQAPMYQSRVEAGATQQQQQGWYPRQRPRDAYPPSADQQHRRYYSQGSQPPQHHSPPKPTYGSMQRMQQQRQYMRGEDGGVDYRARRPSTGYSGRRDDPAVGEDEVDMIMRGASYPGQEWDPYSGRR